MLATLLLCISGALRLLLLSPGGPLFLLHFLVLLFHPVIPTSEAWCCAGHTPLVRRMTGSDSLLPGLGAAPSPPACGLASARPDLLPPAWGAGDTKTCLHWGQCLLFQSHQDVGDKPGGIPTAPPSHQARRPSRRIREAAGGGESLPGP